MKGNRFYLKFIRDKAYLTEKPIDLACLGFTKSFQKSVKITSYWEIYVHQYLPEENKIRAEVLSVRRGDVPFPKEQLNYWTELENVSSIGFGNLETQLLFNTFSDKKIRNPILSCSGSWSVDINKVSAHTDNQRSGRYSQAQSQDDEPARDIPKVEDLLSSLLSPVIKESTIIEETCLVPIKNVNFVNGKVWFHIRTKAHKGRIKLEIKNEQLIEEYDAVKNYFEKVFHTKKITVKYRLEILNKKIISQSVSSESIESIDENTINLLRVEHLKSLDKRHKKAEKDDLLLTLEEYANASKDEGDTKRFLHGDNVGMFENILTASKVTHYHNLRWLSSNHLLAVMNLRILVTPKSFLFVLEGEEKYWLVWETLDTKEATYMWSCRKDKGILKELFADVSKIIANFPQVGKLEYVKTNEDNFARVYHDYKDKNGFTKWKDDILEIIEASSD